MPLREFLYTDVERSRSLLAQLVGGVAESDETSEADSSFGGTVNPGALSVEASRGTSGRRVSQSLQERVSIDREAVERKGYLFDLDRVDDVRDPGEWRTGAVHGLLSDG